MADVELTGGPEINSDDFTTDSKKTDSKTTEGDLRGRDVVVTMGRTTGNTTEQTVFASSVGSINQSTFSEWGKRCECPNHSYAWWTNRACATTGVLSIVSGIVLLILGSPSIYDNKTIYDTGSGLLPGGVIVLWVSGCFWVSEGRR